MEDQIADAAKNAETAKELRSELKQMKKQAEDDRVEFGLRLAGCRNVKAARAVLGDYNGDIESMKEAELSSNHFWYEQSAVLVPEVRRKWYRR